MWQSVPCHLTTKVLSCLGCSSCSGSFIPIWKGVVSVNVSYCQLKKRVYFWLLKKMLTQWYSKCITMIKSLHSNHCNHSNQLLLALLKICNGRLSSKLHHWCFTELLLFFKIEEKENTEHFLINEFNYYQFNNFRLSMSSLLILLTLNLKLNIIIYKQVSRELTMTLIFTLK